MGSSLNGRSRATLTRLDGPGDLQTVTVKWNPAGYRVRRSALRSAPELLGGREPVEFSTELFLDTTGETGVNRNASRLVDVLRSWMDPLPGDLLPPRVLFLWGSFRFAGIIAEMDEEWIRFDPDGTPVRGHLRLLMRE